MNRNYHRPNLSYTVLNPLYSGENQSNQKVTTEKLESELLKITEKVTNTENIVPDQDLIEKTNKLRRSLGQKTEN